jgi:hypothetical protein
MNKGTLLTKYKILTMAAVSKLGPLIYSYYREDPELLTCLEPLLRCRLSRAWFSLRITCPDSGTLAQIASHIPLIREPVALLRLARRIRLSAPGQPAQWFLVQYPHLSGQPSESDTDNGFSFEKRSDY